MKKNFLAKLIFTAIVLAFSLLFVAKFGGPALLRFYVETGMGNCQKIPIFCKVPAERIRAGIDKEYRQELLPYKFPGLEIYLPKGFTVVQQEIRKVYYKRNKFYQKDATIYLFHKGRDFFLGLFPHLEKQGIADDYEFIRHTMYANLNEIKDLRDTFFVIMKGVFIPDLGDQKNVRMAEFKVGTKRGFINYNLTKPNYYFDCNVIDEKEGFFKIYIKDFGARLNLDNVLAIISTATSTPEVEEVRR